MSDLFILKRWGVIDSNNKLYLTKETVKQYDFIIDVKISKKSLLEAFRSYSVELYRVNRKSSLSDLILIANLYNLIFIK